MAYVYKETVSLYRSSFLFCYKIDYMNLFFLEEIDSTNKYAKEHICDFENMSLVYTDNQTNGRGRLGRKWSYGGRDNIYASLILKPSDVMQELYSNLTQYLCVVLCEVFEEYGIVPKIKWPNDIQVNGKKISGILAESVIESGKLQGLVLGFGINLNASEDFLNKIDQPATSLSKETGHKINRDEFLKKLSDRFCLRYDNFIKEGFLLIREDYKERANFLNKPVTVRIFDKKISGIAEDVLESGALSLVDENKEIHVLLIGDIL